MDRFAVVDVETTGFGKSDRLVEIGIVLVDGNEIIQEWETLINPERDISNWDIHGITSDAVSLAPVFGEVVDEISTFLDGRIFVAHNISFDTRMLGQEFTRLNRVVNFGQGLCTLQATKLKLDQACLQYGVINSSAHRALTDARATALILSQVFRNNLILVPVSIEGFNRGTVTRTLSRSALDLVHSSGQQNLRRIARNYEMAGFEGAALSYMDALSSVMSDLEISTDEARHLKEWAADLGLSINQQVKVHQQFLDLVIDAAMRDGFLSETESRLITKTATTLGLATPTIVGLSQELSIDHIKPGMKVCFTGEARDITGASIAREFLETTAATKGLLVVSSVSKQSCELLVAADKSSMSGKAKKARDYGIPVISVEEFLRFIIN